MMPVSQESYSAQRLFLKPFRFYDAVVAGVPALICLLLITFPAFSQAQNRQQMQQANRLAQQGEYEEAVAIYRSLYEQQPESVQLVDRFSNALIQLKAYDEAIEVVKTFNELNSGYPNIAVRVGQIYHMAGEKEQAMDWWNGMIEQHGENVQVYRQVAESMVERREHEAAARMYQDAREAIGNEQMFGFDIAQNFTAAGMYEETMREYSHLLNVNAGFINAVQRQLSRYDDSFFKDIAIMEFEDASREIRPDTDAWKAHREMLIWLYTEQELYRRAFVTAERLEEQLEEQGSREYPVFDLAGQLSSLQEFDLAAQAYRHYTENPEHRLFAESRQEFSTMSIQQARYLLDRNLDFGQRADALYRQAYTLLEELYEMQPDYRRIDDVITVLVEISLDHLKDAQQAREWFAILQPEPEEEEKQGEDASSAAEPALERQARDPAQRQARRIARQADPAVLEYLSGRIYMAEKEFSRARIALSRANREASGSSMRHRTRYFLSLNDVYAGDFEYAGLQVRALQRQSSSYYANDALRLRGILQEGMVRDSVTAELTQFANARYAFDSGRNDEALELLSFFVEQNSDSPALTAPLKPEALLLTNRLLRPRAPMVAYLMMNEYLRPQARSPYLERLYWERARLADALVHAERTEGPDSPKFSIGEELQQDGIPEAFIRLANRSAEQLAGDISAETTAADAVDPPDIEQLIAHYEDLIIEFPRGFYASAARARIRDLQ